MTLCFGSLCGTFFSIAVAAMVLKRGHSMYAGYSKDLEWERQIKEFTVYSRLLTTVSMCQLDIA